MQIIRFFNTVKFLKSIQIYYRILYYIKSKFCSRKIIKYNFKNSQSFNLKLIESLGSYSLYKDGKFSFLNLSKEFQSKVNWNFKEYGKLWTYNLTYFDYLKEKDDLKLIYEFIDNIENVKDGLEPFPTSLRGINWIKFLIKYDIKDEIIDGSLYAQYYMLLDNLEYHLLGNHLLENGFSLLFGSYYFQDEILYKKAKEILKKELKEQILDDGGHFELSPMYHQIMLFRVLDCINLISNNFWKRQELLPLLMEVASKMSGWIRIISYKNGEIPLLNDSANKIAPSTIELLNYASTLNVTIKNVILSQSGYRKIKKDYYECIIDIGQIGPSYIPGHAHADSLNFELNINNKPFIVDTGLSTYNIGVKRDNERSTKSHNTVEVNSKSSSEVWGGFRVGNRAEIVKLNENVDFIEATHNGYEGFFNLLHTRRWEFKEDKLIIIDMLNKESMAVARLHFHPNVTKEEIKNRVYTSCKASIAYYKYSPEFNKNIEAIVLEIPFRKDLKVEIDI